MMDSGPSNGGGYNNGNNNYGQKSGSGSGNKYNKYPNGVNSSQPAIPGINDGTEDNMNGGPYSPTTIDTSNPQLYGS